MLRPGGGDLGVAGRSVTGAPTDERSEGDDEGTHHEQYSDRFDAQQLSPHRPSLGSAVGDCSGHPGWKY
jgi:hypothetical protein